MATPLEQRIDYSFKDPALLKQALTHRSAGAINNERLEFLGDSVLGQVVAVELYRLHPELREGKLSRLRSAVVCEPALAKLARQLDLGNFLHLGAGEIKTGGRDKDSILADALEALIGAIYLDGGHAAAAGFILGQFSALLRGQQSSSSKDAKSRLQEYVQKTMHEVPRYTLLRTSGKPHAQTFDVECRLPGQKKTFHGQGPSRRLAEQRAAASALEMIQKHAG